MKLLNKRGMTLFELLAVIVILGIIALIAVPTVNGIINNTKRDTFAQNAKIFMDTVKTRAQEEVTINETHFNGVTDPHYTLQDMISYGSIEASFLEQDPFGGTFDAGLSKISFSVVTENGIKVVKVTHVELISTEKKVDKTGTNITKISRSDVIGIADGTTTDAATN